MIAEAALQAGKFTGQQAARISGYASSGSVGVAHRGVGQAMGLPKVGSGYRLALNARQVAIMCVCHDAQGFRPSGGGTQDGGQRVRRLVDSLMQSDDWGEFLVLTAEAYRMVDEAAQAVRIALAHAGATIVPLRPFFDRVTSS